MDPTSTRTPHPFVAEGRPGRGESAPSRPCEPPVVAGATRPVSAPVPATGIYASPASVDEPDEATLGRQLRALLLAIRTSPRAGMVRMLAFSILIVITVQSFAQVRLNTWQGAFYDAIAGRDLQVFFHELAVFGVIVSVLIVLTVSQTWFQESLKVRLRQNVAQHLIDEWLRPKRAYRLPLAGEIGLNPDQRIQEDARRLTELSADLGVGLVQASALLVTFIGLLWVLSASVVFALDGSRFTVPGYMVWCALAYALAGSWLTWHIGSPLIRLNVEQRSREAEFRFGLVRIAESAEGIALYNGEGDERRIIGLTLDKTIAKMHEVVAGTVRLTWITSGYGWVAIVVPVVVAAPGYFAGTLSLGGLMMVVGAFYQVQQSLRWYVDNFPRIAEWRATLSRVMSFRDALMRLEALGAEIGRVECRAAPDDAIVIEDLCVYAAHGRLTLDQRRVVIEPGMRVLIAGGAGSGKSTFFRALAGLWPWGRGSLCLPPPANTMFLPHRPYLPLGTLRAVLAYPASEERFSDAQIRAALERVGLARLVPLLDKSERWDQELTLDDQQRVAFVRVLLHRPRWVLHDEAMSAIDEDGRRAIRSLFGHELAETAVVGVGHDEPGGAFYGCVLSLRRDPGGLPMPLSTPA